MKSFLLTITLWLVSISAMKASPPSPLAPTASLESDFGRAIAFNTFLAQEKIALGQRVKSFSLEVWSGGGWEIVARQTTIGYKRILRFPTVKASKLKFNIEAARACPTITNIEVYNSPSLSY